MTAHRRPVVRLVPLLLVLTLAGPGLLAQNAPAQGSLPTPDSFFGFQMGADRKLARWDKIVEYYHLLAKQSDRMKVDVMGQSTEGHPFLALYISSPANLAKLDRFRQINATLSDPRGVAEAEIKKLVAEGKAVIVQSMALHSTEVASAQMAPELTYDLLTRDDDETTRILDNVIAIMIPCFNPDGQIMVTDWYNKHVGTQYEAAGLPWLYQKYVGHDNNRDAFQTNQVESQYAAKILFRDWIPQAYVDHHQMGAYGARIYVPPYAEPIRPGGDPLVWREMSWYGGHIAYKEEEAGKSGVVSAAIYSGWGHMGFHWITPFHNIAGMLTESASARLATPLFLHPDQLSGGARNLPEYEPQTTFPNPWPGGWWRVRDIVEMQKIAAWATLDVAARHRETVLWSAYLKAKRQTERGAAGETSAYIVPAAQHDPLTATKMINKLLDQGIEVHRAATEFVADERVYGAGSFVVSMAQPKMGVVRWLLGRTLYPDNTYTRDRDGNPIRPYDMSTDTMTEFMGVRTDAVAAPVKVDLAKLTAHAPITGGVAAGATTYALDGRLNDSFKAVNLLLAKSGSTPGLGVRRVAAATDTLRAGDFLVGGAPANLLKEIAAQTGVELAPAKDEVTDAYAIRTPRVGMYQRYYGGNMDEGWTRFMLEMFAFPYTSIKDADIKPGNLESKFDVIILPADSVAMMTGERPAEGDGDSGRRGGGSWRDRVEGTPPEFRSGLGKEGVAALQAFVQKGGTLLTFAQAGDLAIQRFGLSLRNVVADQPTKAFWCPGSTLRVRFDNDHPLAYGMPDEGLATFLAGSQVYEIVPSDRNDETAILATYVERDVLQSGWLLGESLIAKRAAAVSVKHGAGRVVLIGFRPQHRS
ncbi:MAG: peptidase M14 family protein, partial [Luteitalea sp.]|nr:peptidase M14 family protein [Luteitalea sp.]